MWAGNTFQGRPGQPDHLQHSSDNAWLWGAGGSRGAAVQVLLESHTQAQAQEKGQLHSHSSSEPRPQPANNSLKYASRQATLMDRAPQFRGVEL